MSRNEVAGLDREATLRGRRLLAARVLWLAVAILVVSLYIAALPYDLQELQRVCSGDDCRVDVQLTGPDALALEDMGLSIGFYAGFFLTIEVLILIVFAVFAGVIFWRRSNDWMALFISLTLLLQGLTLPAIMEQVEEQVPALELVIDFLGHLGLAAIAILFFVFPDGRFVPRWTRFFAIGVALLTLVSFTVFIVPQGGGVATPATTCPIGGPPMVSSSFVPRACPWGSCRGWSMRKRRLHWLPARASFSTATDLWKPTIHRARCSASRA